MDPAFKACFPTEPCIARDFQHETFFEVGPRRFDVRISAPRQSGGLSDRHLSGLMKVLMYIELRLLIPDRKLDAREIAQIGENAQMYCGCKGEILVHLTESAPSNEKST